MSAGCQGWVFARGGILNPKTAKTNRQFTTIKPNHICSIKNRTAFAVFDFQNLRLPQTTKYSRTDDEVEFYKEMEHITTYNIGSQTTQRGSSNSFTTNT
ncbi:unnamed protein product [Prunus armeniaca]